MTRDAPAQFGGAATDRPPTHFLIAAQRSGHQWWRYLIGLVIILFFWLVIGTGARMFVVLAIGGPEGVSAFFRGDHSVIGPVGTFVALMTPFLFFLAGTLVTVALVHRRHPRTLITGANRISWRRIWHGVVAMLVPYALIIGLGQHLLYPGTFSLTSNLTMLALFIPMALAFTAVQTTTEELFFRSYIMHSASALWGSRVFLALASAAVFAFPHVFNPEVSVGGWLTVVLSYFVPGLVWAIVCLVDGAVELAIGAHFAYNSSFFLIVNPTGGAAATPALFTVSELHATFYALAVLVVFPLFLVLSYGVFTRRGRDSDGRSYRSS